MSNIIFGRYHVLNTIDGGGMAIVHRARDTRSGQIVALKVLRKHLWGHPESLERFRREAANAAQLRHPNIVQIYEYDVVDGQPYLAMEYVDGGTLADWLNQNRRPLPLPTAVQVLDGVAAALDYAHAQGIVHRDVKPGNILIASDWQPKLIDFGIAKAAWDSRITQPDIQVGTPAYMAPEQIAGGAVGGYTDVYALGIVLYEMVTGRPPFQGNTNAVLYAHRNTPPPPPRRWNSALPGAAQKALLQALEKQPARRPQTAGSLAAAFRQAVGSRGVAAPAPSRPPSGLVHHPSPSPVPIRVPPAPASKKVQDQPYIVALIIAAVVVLVATVAGALSRSSPPAFPTPQPTLQMTRRPSPTATTEATAVSTVTPSPTRRLSAPQLTGPGDKVGVSASAEVVLTWRWERPLEGREHFLVIVQDDAGHTVMQRTTSRTELRFKPRDEDLTAGATYHWTVRVEREVEGEAQAQTAQAGQRAFRVLADPTRTPTPVPIVRPRLVNPEHGHTYKNPIVFRWEGSLGAGQAYRVRAWRVGEGGRVDYERTSELLSGRSWKVDLPPEKFGEWRWTVSVLQDGRVVTTSAERMFWFDQFSGMRPLNEDLSQLNADAADALLRSERRLTLICSDLPRNQESPHQIVDDVEAWKQRKSC